MRDLFSQCACLQRQVTKETFNRMDADGAVRECPIADVLARVIADPAVDRWLSITPDAQYHMSLFFKVF